MSEDQPNPQPPPQSAPESNAARLAGTWILHRPTLVVGKVTKVHPKGTYMAPGAPEGEEPVPGEVVELQAGHAFLFPGEKGAFVPLSPAEVQLYERGEKAMAWVLQECVVFAKSTQVGQREAIDMLKAVVAAQLRALQKGMPNAEG